jgi:hypothetical protein
MRTRRGIPAPIERAVNSVFSRGSGYEPTPIGHAFDDASVRGYYIDFRAKTTAPSAHQLDILPATPLIQLALGWWERHLAQDESALEQFIRLCGIIEERGEPAGAELRWPIRVRVAKYGLAPPWCSALSQGQAASVFVRAHLATNDERYASLATQAIRPLLADRESDLVTQTEMGPLLEEAPSEPRSHILNGWISALWGLWDVHQGLGDERACRVFRSSLDCLKAHLPAYDTGWWTLYSLYPHPLRDLAKPIYHRVHIVQLDVLHSLTGDEALRTTAARWRTYDRPVNRSRAIAQKTAFVVADGQRRRRWDREVSAPTSE